MFDGESNSIIDQLERFSRDASWEEIGAMSDPIFRNYLITHNYWRLSERMSELLGRQNMVWPGFGAWASAQAGELMRHDGMEWLSLVPRFGQRITTLLGRGNRLIFMDIAPVFSRFIELMDPSDAAVQAEHKRLVDGAPHEVPAYLQDALGLDPRPVDEHPEGQQAMIWAFSEYFMAAHEACPEERSERIYVANCFVGLQEQTRIDCMLDALLEVEGINRVWMALAAPLIRLCGAGQRLQGAVGRRLGRRPNSCRSNLCRQDAYRVLHTAFVDGRLTQVLGTQLVMSLEVGGERLDISDDVPWTSTTAAYPAHLARFDEPSAEFRARLEALLAWDCTPDTPDGSAAVDWTELADRMNYIVDLFRTRQQDPGLFDHPLDQTPVDALAELAAV